MKEKTSITLSKTALANIDRVVGSKQSRSSFIQSLVDEHFHRQARAQRDARDIELINRHADELNAEVEDVLRYQASED